MWSNKLRVTARVLPLGIDTIDTFDRSATIGGEMDSEVIEEARKEIVNLREYGERLSDDQIVGSASRALELLHQIRRRQLPVGTPGLLSISEAIRVSGRSRNTIKG